MAAPAARDAGGAGARGEVDRGRSSGGDRGPGQRPALPHHRDGAAVSAVVIPVRQGTDEWRAARRSGIGSSDAAVVAGEKGSVVELWGEKTGLAPRPEPDQELAERFAWGHRMEPLLALAYTEREGRPLRRLTRLLRHPDVPFALASLDRVSAVKGERRIVEIKVSDLDAKWRDGELPGDVKAQVQHQLWVTGYDVADV